jgi:hypothetical protein
MKKLLLSLVAVLATSASFAYEVDDYIYTKDAKFKVISTKGVGALNTWNGADDVDVWSVYTGEDATDNSLESLDGGEGTTLLFTNVKLTYGSNYVFTIRIKGVSETTSSITAGGQNEINAFITWETPSADGVVTGTAGEDYIQVASTATILNGEWTEISFSYENSDTIFTMDKDRYFNITLGRLTTGTVVADAQFCQVINVFDTRITDRKVDFINKILVDENFSSGDSEEIEYMLEQYAEMVEGGDADDANEMKDFVEMLDEAVATFMDESSTDLSGEFQYIDIFSFGRYNRGSISNGQVIGGFKFYGENWLHSWGKNASDQYDASLSSYNLAKQIQNGYNNGPGALALYNTNLPAGKYYIAAEVRNGYLDKNYNITYTLEKAVKAFVGSDTIELGTIVGEDYQKFYYVGELKDGETFEAGFWWEGTPDGTGSAFHIQNLEIRGINGEGESIEDKIEREKIVQAFLAQWNAATSQRNALLQKQADKETYPWEQDSIQSALDTWDPYYQKVLADGWVDAEGNVAGKSVVSNDELTEWTKYQGVELYNDEGTQLEYQLVRNFQWANNFVAEQNQPVADLKAKIAEAKEIKANPDFASGDFDDFDSILEAAEELVAGISAVNQGEEFAATTQALDDAIKEFLDNFASYKYPLALNVINGDFQDVSGRSLNSDGYRSIGGQVDEWNGWTYYSNDSKEYFRIADAGTDENGEYIYQGHNRAGMWRGWSGNPCGSVTQEIAVSKPGMYVFKCQAYCIGDGDGKKILAGVRKIHIETEIQYVEDEEGEWVEEEIEISRDTTYMSGVKLIFGSTEAEKLDSLEIWTQGEGDSGNYTPQWFTMEYDKKTANEEIIKFGLDGLSIGEYASAGIYTYGPNAYGIGSVTVSYGGPTDKYLEDKAAAEEEAQKVTVEDITALIEQYLDGVEGITIETITNLIDKYLAQ